MDGNFTNYINTSSALDCNFTSQYTVAKIIVFAFIGIETSMDGVCIIEATKRLQHFDNL